jgi:hypothetical protein
MALDFPRRHATGMAAARYPGRDRTDPAPTPQAADKFQARRRNQPLHPPVSPCRGRSWSRAATSWNGWAETITGPCASPRGTFPRLVAFFSKREEQRP